MICKAAYITCMAVTFIIASEYSKLTDGKFLACITFGYMCFRFWGSEKPMKEVGWVWFFIQPMLFGTVGASLLIKNINTSDIGNSFGIIIIAGIVRFAAMFLVTLKQKLTIKERILMGITWGSKGSITAIFGGVILLEATAKGAGYEEYANYGN